MTRKFIKEIKRQLSIAPQKVIVTSGIIQIVKATIAAFKINVNKPSVTNNNCNANIVAIGFTIVFTSEKTRPAIT